MIQPVLFALLYLNTHHFTFYIKGGNQWRHPEWLWGNTSVIGALSHLIFTGFSNLFTICRFDWNGAFLQFLYVIVGTQKWNHFGRYVMSLSFAFLLLGVFLQMRVRIIVRWIWVPIHAALIRLVYVHLFSIFHSVCSTSLYNIG